MTTSASKAISLDKFLSLPESKPAKEYLDGEITTKPMPKVKYSRLQLKLGNSINEAAESSKVAYALPELRCSFGNRSILVFFSNRQPVLLQQSDILPVLEDIDLKLEVTQVFSWLKMT